MTVYARVGLLALALALVVSVGCSKSSSEKDTKATATDQAGLVSERLLVLKFHHDK